MRRKTFKKSSDYFKFFNKRRDKIKVKELYFTRKKICVVYELIMC